MYKFENANVKKDFYMPSSNICPIYEFDENGNALFLEVYSASSGPAIGGINDSDSKSAASELALYIRQAQAIDYDYEGYYLDTMSKVHHRIKNGVPSWEETEMSEKEFEEFDEEVWY